MDCIELNHLGRDRVIGCWRVGDVLVDPGPQSCEATLLQALGGDRPRALLLTHIHLDHAGATGALVRRWPDLEVWVHEVGAPHLVDPSKLLKSAGRLYGDDMERLWGEVVPVPEGNVRMLKGGEELEGGFRVEYTPGHASHHVSYFHAESGVAFTGDTTGVRIPPAGLTVAPTPPPDIDVEAWHRSLDLIAAWQPRALGITHFGRIDDVAAQLSEVRYRLDRQAELARTNDEAGFVEAIRAELQETTDLDTAAAFEQAAPPEQLYQGLERYWRKRSTID